MFSDLSTVPREVWHFLNKSSAAKKHPVWKKNSGLKWCNLSMEINLNLIQLSLLHTRVRRQGVITATHLSYKATGKKNQKKTFFVVLFFFPNLFLSCPSLIFTTGGLKSFCSTFIYAFLFYLYYTPLAFKQACISEQGGRQWLVVSSATEQQNH